MFSKTDIICLAVIAAVTIIAYLIARKRPKLGDDRNETDGRD